MSNTAKPPGRLQAWAMTHQPQAAAAAGGLVVVVLALRARAKRSAGGSSAPAVGDTAATAGTAGTYTAGLVAPNTSTSDIENYMQDQLNALQSSVDAQLSAAANQPTEPAPGSGVPRPIDPGNVIRRPPVGSPRPAVPPGTFIIPGKLDQGVALRSIAASLLPANERNNPNAVEAALRRLVAANPSLKGRTTAPGGHRLKRPA